MVFIFILILLFSVGRYIDLSSLALSTDSPFYTMLTFHFIHFKWYHLLSNLFLFVFYWRYMRVSNYRFTIPIIIVSSLLAAWVSRYATPTVGCSAIIMAMAGILVATLNRKLLLKNLLIFALSFAILACVSHINTLIHITSFTTAFILAKAAGNKHICRRR